MAKPSLTKPDAEKLPVSRPTIAKLAVDAGCDPRTLVKALKGEKIRGGLIYRIKDALKREGLESLTSRLAA